MAELSLTVTGVRFPNPVLTAAGPNVLGLRLMLEAAAGGAGGWRWGGALKEKLLAAEVRAGPEKLLSQTE